MSIYPWRVSYGPSGRAIAVVCKLSYMQTLSLHREIMDAQDGQIIDHINGDPLDNQRCKSKDLHPCRKHEESAQTRQ